MLPHPPAVHLAVTAREIWLVAAFYRARLGCGPQPGKTGLARVALELPPLVVTAAPATRHYQPVAPIDLAYSRVFVHTLEYTSHCCYW